MHPLTACVCGRCICGCLCDMDDWQAAIVFVGWLENDGSGRVHGDDFHSSRLNAISNIHHHFSHIFPIECAIAFWIFHNTHTIIANSAAKTPHSSPILYAVQTFRMLQVVQYTFLFLVQKQPSIAINEKSTFSALNPNQIIGEASNLFAWKIQSVFIQLLTSFNNNFRFTYLVQNFNSVYVNEKIPWMSNFR